MLLTKRLIDIFLSLIRLALSIPVFPIIGMLIKLDSRGPVFSRVDRVGKDMKNFKMIKFRTMIDTPIEVGESISPQYDPRVTTFGRFLRRTKMNELPQFINILKGEMTFVGPRPEAPDLAALYPEEAKKVFSVKPGLVGPANTDTVAQAPILAAGRRAGHGNHQRRSNHQPQRNWPGQYP